MGTPKAAVSSSVRISPAVSRTRCDTITGSHAQAGKQKAIEHHVLHAHLVERQPAQVEPSAPQGSGQGAGAVAEKTEAPGCLSLFAIPSLLSHTRGQAGGIT